MLISVKLVSECLSNLGIIKELSPTKKRRLLNFSINTTDHLLLDRSPNIGPLISHWELDKFENCWNKSIRTCKILTLLYQQFLNLIISQRDMSGPRLGALSNNRWSGGKIEGRIISTYFCIKLVLIWSCFKIDNISRLELKKSKDI
jgi:hypothetical protein